MGARYSGVAILLHWLIAAAILFELALGWRMDGPNSPERFAVFQLHKSVGITILLLTLARIAWRLTHRPPPLSAALAPWERWLAHGTHILFYMLLLALPLSGWLAVSTSSRAIPTLLYGVVPWPHVPGTAGLAAPAREALHEGAEGAHEAMIFLMLGLLFLHVAGALKHHILDRDETLGRMMPGVARLFDWRLAAVLALLFGAFVAGGRMPLSAAAAPAAAPASPEPIAENIAMAENASAAAIEAAPENMSAAAEPAVEEQEDVEPSRWSVQPGSTLTFTTRWSGGTVEGRFARFDADIRFDPAALDDSRVKVDIDMTSVSTGDVDSNGALPGEEFFAVSRFPRARFEAENFRSLGGDRYEARGTLRLRGVERPQTLPFTLTIRGDVATMRGTATIDRSAHGVGQGEWAATNDLPAAVSVSVAITARRTAP